MKKKLLGATFNFVNQSIFSFNIPLFLTCGRDGLLNMKSCILACFPLYFMHLCTKGEDGLQMQQKQC